MSYCDKCDDYGHSATDHKPRISVSEYHKYKASKGDDWWIDESADPNGIGPVCMWCGKLIDWGPRDHTIPCPVRQYMRFEEDLWQGDPAENS